MYRQLRIFRIIISLIFFLLITFIFIDFRGLFPVKYISAVTWLQFGPSLVSFFQVAGIAATGFMVILLLTIILGRVYCSFICPLGVLQDILIRINRFLKRKKRLYRFKKPVRWRYMIALLAILPVLFGSMLIFNLLEPYSNFGKLASGLFRPSFIGLNNLAGFIFQKSDLVTINLYPIRGFDIPSLIFPLVLLITLFALTYKRGRLFCNLLCPVGTILGVCSRYALVKIKLDKTKCNQCGLCLAKCKAECIDIKHQAIDHSRCVMCFDCIGPCPDNGVNLQWALPGILPDNKQSVTEIAWKNASRRKFLGSAILLWLASRTAAKPDLSDTAFTKPTKIPENKKVAVSPPGSLSIEQFNSRCIACHLCVSACPTQVLQPSLLQYGLQGFMQPYMDYHSNFCNFDCVICTQVCPTQALTTLEVEEKHTIQLGKTTFIKENCVVYTFNTACGACSEHCPTKAVQMVPYQNGLKIPEVDQSICVGCGACEYACPTKPYKAIYVDGNPVHLKAKAPKEEQVERVPETEDFPF